MDGRRAAPAVIATLISLSTATGAFADQLDERALIDRAAAEANRGDYRDACRDFAAAAARANGFRDSQPSPERGTPDADEAARTIALARGWAGNEQYALACVLAYSGAITWHLLGNQASTDAISREAAGYAQQAGLAAPAEKTRG